LQTRKYGAQLCVTPMVNARSFVTSDHYRAKVRPDAAKRSF
jgi:tRNA-dihydrouridine synthase